MDEKARQLENALAQVVLHLDRTRESEAVRMAFERAGKPFVVVYESGTRDAVPAIETPYGIVRGYDTIRSYLRIIECVDSAT